MRLGSDFSRFLLAQLHMESLTDPMSKKEMREALRSLPKEIDETYDRTMGRIRAQKPKFVLLAERILAWIANARRPLTVKELQHALAVEPGQVRSCLNIGPKKAKLTPDSTRPSLTEMLLSLRIVLSQSALG